jgi:hypothetical protein
MNAKNKSRLLRRVVVVGGLAALMFLAVGIVYAATVNVDTFNVGTQSLVANMSDTHDASSVSGGSDVLRTYRDAEVNYISGGTGVDITLKIDAGEDPGTNRLSFSAESGGTGTAKVTWDGDQDPETLDATGLNNADLVSSSPANGGIYIVALNADRTATLKLTGYDDATNYEDLSITVNQNDQGITRLDLFYPFDIFTVRGGTGADWSSLGALVLDISGDQDLDLTIDYMDARADVREYGDLPDTTPNYSAVLGAYHVPKGLTLGANLDADTTYHASTDANGDDTSDYDDEDGATPLLAEPIPGTWVWYAVVATNGCPGTCYLNGWIDWDSDGDFADTGEHFINNVIKADGTTSYYINQASSISSGFYYLRFRVCDVNGQCDDPGTSDTSASNGEVEDYRWPLGPTAVTLDSFSAAWQGSQVLVEWTTAQEINTVGFNLWRSTSLDGEYVQVNDTLIPAESLGGVMGGSYSFSDSGVTPGSTYYYKLEELEVGGAHNWYGPAVLGEGGRSDPTAVTLSRFAAIGAAWWPVGALVGVGLAAVWLWRRRRA